MINVKLDNSHTEDTFNLQVYMFLGNNKNGVKSGKLELYTLKKWVAI
jgi:hypothetical protein